MVHLLDTEGMRAASMPTDGAGRFTLQAPAAGTFRIEAVRSGYVSAETPSFEVAETGVTVVPTLRLEADEAAIENLPVPGRTIMGRVVAEGFDEPLPSTLVRVLDEGYDGVAATTTDAAGRFSLQVPEAGVYRVEALRTGYEPVRVEGVEVGDEQGRRVRLELAHESVQPGEDYYHRQTNLTRGRAQFNERGEQGLGFHLDGESLRSMDLPRVSEAFRGIPGLRVETDPRGRAMIRSLMGWGCFVLIQDHQVSSPLVGGTHENMRLPQVGLRGFDGNVNRHDRWRGPRVPLDDLDLDEIEGIEIYRSYREVPDELKQSVLHRWLWERDRLGGCGVAIIWTRTAW